VPVYSLYPYGANSVTNAFTFGLNLEAYLIRTWRLLSQSLPGRVVVWPTVIAQATGLL